ncbi:hypothetical protein AMS68_003632 [Peltaster fructicola]|uniref:pH-response regulator protein palC n=1 Tax=Peltaster fructicola TaxID=286661 RepID=A0A6H0XTZ4_9PEZI|nr:hypothetical protein AMS68_003632 [Peltaster fructicola]
MPFPFELPTTGSVDFSTSLRSETHPALSLTATGKRSVLKDVLKRHKRRALKDRAVHLPLVADAIQAYLPYLLALDATQAQYSSQEQPLVEQDGAFITEWRSTLSATLPGREAPRPRLSGLHHELAFTLSTLAYTRSLQARSHLRGLYDGTVLTGEARTAAIVSASKDLLEANSVYAHLLSRRAVSTATDAPVDTQPATLAALASLALAEANLVFVAKDDPYAAAVADDRNDDNFEWMYKAPTIPKVRASLYARICVAAAEHATQAHGSFSRPVSGKINDDLIKYTNDLRRTARAKAIRLLAVNAEASGSTGEALAFLNGAKRELGISNEGKRKGFKGLKQSWQERREDRKLEKGGEWGMDGGRLEEARIVEMLETKWDKENSTANVQVVPPFEPLLRQLPSGRDPHTLQVWSPPVLDANELASMRAPPEPADLYQAEEDDSGVEDLYTAMPKLSVGAFPQADAGQKAPYY